jgi:glycosyltransferase involved in cell wall biosynthesis
MVNKHEPLISVVLPVYNRPEYLGKAIDSVLNQTYPKWELIIADDASDRETRELYRKYGSIPQIKIHFNSENVGLFPNLNQGIVRCEGAYIVLLCSDDFLFPGCLEVNLNLAQDYPSAGLILSPVEVVDGNDRPLPSYSVGYYDDFAKKQRQLFEPHETIPLLLKYGSINCSLTGMFFPRTVFHQAGGFREDWKHAADWEWIYRVCRFHPILISKTPVATVRFHTGQLSGVNFRNLRDSTEAIEMVRMLLADPIVSRVDAAPRWAVHTLQYHLWFALKLAVHGNLRALTLLRNIDQVTGFPNTLWAMLRWLPERWRVYRKRAFPMPPA